MTQAKPTSTPINAKPGKPLTFAWLAGPIAQPTAPAAMRMTINTPAALTVPATVMVLRLHGLTGPSVIGPSVIGAARVTGSGAPQPGFLAAWFQPLSFSNGFGMHASLGELSNR